MLNNLTLIRERSLFISKYSAADIRAETHIYVSLMRFATRLISMGDLNHGFADRKISLSSPM